MGRIEDFQAVIAIVDKGSLTAAARLLGRSLQSVSRSLAALELEVGVELVRRTTRQSSPTEAGTALHRRLSAALAEIDTAKREASARRTEPAGLLCITSSTALSPLYLVPAAAAFLAAHRKVEIELDQSDGYVDLIGEGFDLAIRIGALPDSSLKARQLATLRRVVFAPPAYFARHGRPAHPEELVGHQCIVRTAAREGNAWPFRIDRRLRTIRGGWAVPVQRGAGCERGGRAGARHRQRAAMAGALAGGPRCGRAGHGTIRAATGAGPCGVAADSRAAGQDAIVRRFPRRSAWQGVAVTWTVGWGAEQIPGQGVSAASAVRAGRGRPI